MRFFRRFFQRYHYQHDILVKKTKKQNELLLSVNSWDFQMPMYEILLLVYRRVNLLLNTNRWDRTLMSKGSTLRINRLLMFFLIRESRSILLSNILWLIRTIRLILIVTNFIKDITFQPSSLLPSSGFPYVDWYRIPVVYCAVCSRPFLLYQILFSYVVIRWQQHD